jgi:hypothetical protein
MNTKLIERVQVMEEDFHAVRDIMNEMEVAISHFESVQERIEHLSNYLENGQFLKDFEADERGELPKDMSRGVLSEDALYDLLEDVTEMRSRLKAIVDPSSDI